MEFPFTEAVTILKRLYSGLNRMVRSADPCPIEILNFSTLLESSRKLYR